MIFLGIFSSNKMATKHVCVKKDNLNKIGCDNFREWLADPRNIYVGRAGRLSIKEKNGDITFFRYAGSKWGNPFIVSEDSPVERVLQLYKNHLEKSGLIKQVKNLKGYNLGCFCLPNAPCHAKVLSDLANNS